MNSKRTAGSVLVVGALGVVFGDIGTSPLYTLQAVSKISSIELTPSVVYGIISLIIWAVTVVVSIKYISLILRTDNHGEGGIMALLGLLQSRLHSQHAVKAWLLLSLAGLALFYGDSVITPAISVLSAVEGIRVIEPQATAYVVPLTILIVAGLFALQSKGSGKVGAVFGPIMVVWFVASGLAGLSQIIAHPGVLQTLLPTTALSFAAEHPGATFLMLGAIVLAVTGAEALYADIGHFGRTAVQKAWFGLVFPALLLTYMGQGALLAASGSATSSPYFLMYPESLRLPAVILATLATCIASQAVLSGAFSLTRQAVRLGFLPPMNIKHTSKDEFGQVYIGFMNWLIFILVVGLIVTFQSSAHLAAAFGMAVSATMLIDSLLFFAVMRYINQWSRAKIIFCSAGFIVLDSLFVLGSLTKFIHGGWVPVLIALSSFVILTTWIKGRRIIMVERQHKEGKLSSFVQRLHTPIGHQIPRIKGSAIFISHHPGYTPLALRAAVAQLHELSASIAVVTIETTETPHVLETKRAQVDALGDTDDGICAVRLRFGFNDVPNVPLALSRLQDITAELSFDPHASTYFISDSELVVSKGRHHMTSLRKRLYSILYRRSASSVSYFHLPSRQTIDLATYLEL